MKKTVGIIGGMGPMATCDLYRKIIEQTPAAKDQEHLHVIIDGNTNIPDRTAAILSGGSDPLPELKKSAERLIAAGADILCMPCNTAHYFYPAVSEYARSLKNDICFVNMLEETALCAKQSKLETVGLLATDGTIRSGVYGRAFAALGIKVLCPEGADQAAVMSIIYDGVKAGKTLDPAPFIHTMEALLSQGAGALILGCTELPLAFQSYDFSFPNIDPTTVLAKAVIKAALGQ